MSTPTPPHTPEPSSQSDQFDRPPRPLFPLTLLISETYAMTDEDGTRYVWDVAQGRSLAEARGADPFAFHPAEHGITPEHIRARYPDLDERYASTLTDDDLARPLLFLPFWGKHLLVDGWHRLWRCITAPPGEAPSRLPAYVLTEAESDEILVSRVPSAMASVQQTEGPTR